MQNNSIKHPNIKNCWFSWIIWVSGLRNLEKLMLIWNLKIHFLFHIWSEGTQITKIWFTICNFVKQWVSLPKSSLMMDPVRERYFLMFDQRREPLGRAGPPTMQDVGGSARSGVGLLLLHREIGKIWNSSLNKQRAFIAKLFLGF